MVWIVALRSVSKQGRGVVAEEAEAGRDEIDVESELATSEDMPPLLLFLVTLEDMPLLLLLLLFVCVGASGHQPARRRLMLRWPRALHSATGSRCQPTRR